ncbi:hypothetical protein Klosneuvirus_3_124 [Klosneuvirus KNV1]|uniref:F-box domain-containing protein n=1 Tax=Klosneuvirus KNV1 TaxID=1977640 RepID=A0A1V0SJS3_9VIRU|nr:hypothetical protein Klosneuvirus_3_124 [Klosneuvirus KNV1]
MDVLTGINDINLEICYLLDFDDLCILCETCKYFAEIMNSDVFWKKYLYNILRRYYINPLILEKYRPLNELYVESFIKYYCIKTIEDAIKNNRLDAILFLKTNNIQPNIKICREVFWNNNVIVSEFLYNEFALLPIDAEIYKPKVLPNDMRGPKILKTRMPSEGRDRGICRENVEYASSNVLINTIIYQSKVEILDWLYRKCPEAVICQSYIFDDYWTKCYYSEVYRWYIKNNLIMSE